MICEPSIRQLRLLLVFILCLQTVSLSKLVYTGQSVHCVRLYSTRVNLRSRIMASKQSYLGLLKQLLKYTERVERYRHHVVFNSTYLKLNLFVAIRALNWCHLCFYFFSVNSSCFGGLLPAEDVLCHIENLHLRELRAIDLGNLDSFLCSYPFLQTDSLSKLVCTGQSVHCVHVHLLSWLWERHPTISLKNVETPDV